MFGVLEQFWLDVFPDVTHDSCIGYRVDPGLPDVGPSLYPLNDGGLFLSTAEALACQIELIGLVAGD